MSDKETQVDNTSQTPFDVRNVRMPISRLLKSFKRIVGNLCPDQNLFLMMYNFASDLVLVTKPIEALPVVFLNRLSDKGSAPS